VRILIADDHTLFREGLRALLEEQPGFRVVGEASDGRAVLSLVGELKPDILLLDLQMPKLHGMEVLRRIGALGAGLRTILLAAVMEAEQIREALSLGARGVVLKESAITLLFKCISTVMAGQYWIGCEPVSDLSHLSAENLHSGPSKAQSKNFGLTEREIEVLNVVVAGKTNREIAEQFSISEQTVKHHITHVFDKVGVYNRLELALFAIHHGLVRKTGPK